MFRKVPDYHMHTPRCNHAKGTIIEYAQAAVDVGLIEIGMSDHSPMSSGFDKAWRMDESELDSFLEELEAAQRQFKGQLTIKSALEVDYYVGAEEYIQFLADYYDWDYLMGSVHFIGDWGFDNPDEVSRFETCDIEQAYCDYFKLVEQSATCGLFDIIGHPDLIKKFGYRAPQGSSAVFEAENNMLQAVKKADVALEISSAGLRKPVKEIYPHSSIIERACLSDIPFAYGSDAHSPAEVGHAMDVCLGVLQGFGMTQVSQFSKRQRQMFDFMATT
ncbi:MAG: histidinol-phosphatase HisJ family protein [Ghiorsea sp.]|nr:histidinol-phosphatase HisJ family protein [Ghiorsea sp.]